MDIIGFALASLLIELTPGPNMGWLAAMAMARGRGPALAAVAGIALGLAAIGVLTTGGVIGFIYEVPAVRQALRYAGAGYLLYLAWEAWRGEADTSTPGAHALSFWRGLYTNLLNPKAALFYVAVLPRFAGGAPVSLGNAFTLVAIYVAIATAVHVAIALAAAQAQSMIARALGSERIRIAFAALLVATAAWFLWSTRGV